MPSPGTIPPGLSVYERSADSRCARFRTPISAGRPSGGDGGKAGFPDACGECPARSHIGPIAACSDRPQPSSWRGAAYVATKKIRMAALIAVITATGRFSRNRIVVPHHIEPTEFPGAMLDAIQRRRRCEHTLPPCATEQFDRRGFDRPQARTLPPAGRSTHAGSRPSLQCRLSDTTREMGRRSLEREKKISSF